MADAKKSLHTIGVDQSYRGKFFNALYIISNISNAYSISQSPFLINPICHTFSFTLI